MADDTIKTFIPRFEYEGTTIPMRRVWLYISEIDAPFEFDSSRFHRVDDFGHAAVLPDEKPPEEQAASAAEDEGEEDEEDDDDGEGLRLGTAEFIAGSPVELSAAGHVYGFVHAHFPLTQEQLDRLPEAAVAQRRLTAKDAAAGVVRLPSCDRTAKQLFQVKGVAFKHFGEPDKAFFFRSKMSVCADGAPNAYHPVSGKGIDNLGNAGGPGNWYGVVTDTGKETGTPVVQPKGSRYEGFYVSPTSMHDPENDDPQDPARYVNPVEVPYVVLPGHGKKKVPDPKHPGKLKTVSAPPRHPAHLGDVAVVYNTTNNLLAYAIYAEVGPAASSGEASIKLCDLLGTYESFKKRRRAERAKKRAEEEKKKAALAKKAGKPEEAKPPAAPAEPEEVELDARHGGEDGQKILYLIFPGTKKDWPWRTSVDEIAVEGKRLFEAWGGLNRLACCFPEFFPREAFGLTPFAEPAKVKAKVKAKAKKK